MKFEASELLRFGRVVPNCCSTIFSSSSAVILRRRAKFSIARICAVLGFGPEFSRLPPLGVSSLGAGLPALFASFCEPFPLFDGGEFCFPLPVAGAVFCFPFPASGFAGSVLLGFPLPGFSSPITSSSRSPSSSRQVMPMFVKSRSARALARVAAMRRM